MCRSTVIFATLLLIVPAAHLVRAEDGHEAPLVVGSSNQLSTMLARLAGSAIRVERLFDPASETAYAVDNQRACRVRDNAVLVIADSQHEAGVRLWMERFHGEGVALHYVATDGRSSSEERILYQLHDIVVHRFPKQRQVFDARLSAELQRLRAGRITRLAGNP